MSGCTVGFGLFARGTWSDVKNFQLENISMSMQKLARFFFIAAVGSFSVYSFQAGSNVAISGESLGIEQDFLFLNQTECPAPASRSGHRESGEVLLDWEFTKAVKPPRCRGFPR